MTTPLERYNVRIQGFFAGITPQQRQAFEDWKTERDIGISTTSNPDLSPEIVQEDIDAMSADARAVFDAAIQAMELSVQLEENQPNNPKFWTFQGAHADAAYVATLITALENNPAGQESDLTRRHTAAEAAAAAAAAKQSGAGGATGGGGDDSSDNDDPQIPDALQAELDKVTTLYNELDALQKRSNSLLTQIRDDAATIKDPQYGAHDTGIERRADELVEQADGLEDEASRIFAAAKREYDKLNVTDTSRNRTTTDAEKNKRVAELQTLLAQLQQLKPDLQAKVTELEIRERESAQTAANYGRLASYTDDPGGKAIEAFNWLKNWGYGGTEVGEQAGNAAKAGMGFLTQAWNWTGTELGKMSKNKGFGGEWGQWILGAGGGFVMAYGLASMYSGWMDKTLGRIPIIGSFVSGLATLGIAGIIVLGGGKAITSYLQGEGSNVPDSFNQATRIASRGQALAQTQNISTQINAGSGADSVDGGHGTDDLSIGASFAVGHDGTPAGTQYTGADRTTVEFLNTNLRSSEALEREGDLAIGTGRHVPYLSMAGYDAGRADLRPRGLDQLVALAANPENGPLNVAERMEASIEMIGHDGRGEDPQIIPVAARAAQMRAGMEMEYAPS